MARFQISPITATTMKKVSFTLVSSMMLLLFAVPLWAQCGEGSPDSCEIVIQQTFTLEPGVTVSLPVGNTNLYKFKPLDNVGGESLTITAISILESDFDNTDPPVESCVPIREFSGTGYASRTCIEFQHDCSGSDCGTFHYQVVFNYDLPSDLPAIGGPDWRLRHGVDCPILASEQPFTQSIFIAYSVTRSDPKHVGGDTGPSCNVPEWTPSATPITSATGFVGFNPPVSNLSLNTIKAGRTVPLKWNQLDRFGTPVTNLTLCTDPTTATCIGTWVMAGATPIVCPPGTGGTVTAGLTALTGTFMNQGGGRYHFNWNTPSNSTGCVAVVFIFGLGGPDQVVVSPANFSFF
ncbi:MAG: PxKF domain-containing protein [Acidobacteria bacterium]|nr:PxKF domain-containing protein [Acidobacteriota bacterium]